MKCKFTLFITALLILICCIGAASAADDISDDALSTDSDVGVIEQTDDATLEVNNEEQTVLSGTPQSVSTWADLKNYSMRTDADYEITVANGTYNVGSDQVDFGNNAKIIGSGNTVITGGDSSVTTFTGTGKSITFSNLIFRNMNSNMVIHLIDSGSSKIENCIFENIVTSTSGQKSVVYNNGGYMNISNCNFTNCNTTYGVVTNHKTATTTFMDVENCRFVNNRASAEPGAINNCGVLNVTNSTFINNRAAWWAGAITTFTSSSTTIKKSVFTSNTCGMNGGALYTYSVLNIYDTIFTDNNCSGSFGGGAIGAYNFNSQYDILVVNCTFNRNNNLATNGKGGAIATLNGGHLNVYNSTFVANSAKIGQAISATNQKVENGTNDKPYLAIDGNTFINHTGSSNTVLITGVVSSFKNNIFNNSVQSTFYTGTGNTITSGNNLPLKSNDLLGCSSEDLLTDITREITDNTSFSDAFSNSADDGVNNPNQNVIIKVADGIYTVSINPASYTYVDTVYDNDWINSASMYVPFSGLNLVFWGVYTIEGIGDNVIFRCADGYNLDIKTICNNDYGEDSIFDTIIHKNIVFDCDVILGCRNYEFINCTFNKTLNVNGYDFADYWNLYGGNPDVVNNMTFINCTFSFDKENIGINQIPDAGELNLQFKDNSVDLKFDNCKFPVYAVDSKLSISNQTNIVIVTLTDAEGNPIKGATVNYNTTSGVKDSNITGEDGSFTISGLTGEFTINATYTGNESYKPSNNSASFNFKLPAVETTLNISSTEKGIVTITVKDAKGKPIANAEVKYNNGGENTTKTTNDEGIVTVSGLTGEGEIKAYFEGNDTYLKSEGSYKYNFTEPTPTPDKEDQKTTPKVTKKATKITAKKKTFKAKKKTKKYTIVLKAGKKAVKKVKVTLKVGKKTYKATTNSKGKATFNLKKLTKKGKYTAVIKFAGNKNYKATSKKVKITVKK